MDSEEFRQFIIDTPFSSRTTDEEKFQRFLQTRSLFKRKRKSNAEKQRDYRASKKSKHINLNPPERKSNAERQRQYRLRKKASRGTAENAADALSLCSLNVQSLPAHSLDITSDFVLPSCALLALSETWLSNAECDQFKLKSFKLISRCKRDNGIAAGGVAIYEREADSHTRQSEPLALIHINKESTGLEEISVCSTDVGDICKAEITIDGERVLLVTIYLSNRTTLSEKIQFFERYLQPYSIKLRGLFLFLEPLRLFEKPIVLCGDFNIDFRSDDGIQFRKFMSETFGCSLSNSVDVSTTRNMTCIDGIFTRNVNNVQTLAYISYFSHHRPLLSITTTNDYPVGS